MTTTTETQHWQEVETLQRTWLQEAVNKKAKDILAHARKTGEKLHDENLRRLERDFKRIRQHQDDSTPENLAELRNRYNANTLHHSESDPVYAALKPFLSTTGTARQRLEDIAREHLCMEPQYLELARQHPDKAEHYSELAAQERQRADMAISKSNDNQALPASEKPNSPRALKNQRFSLKTLEKVVDTFRDRTWNRLHLRDHTQDNPGDHDCQDDEEHLTHQEDEDEDNNNEDKDNDNEDNPSAAYDGTMTTHRKNGPRTVPPPFHDPGEPDIRLDEDTLRQICKQANTEEEIPGNLQVLLIGPKGDQAIALEIQKIEEQAEQANREHRAKQICKKAWEAWNSIKREAQHRVPPDTPDTLHDIITLTAAWSDSQWEGDMPEYMTYLMDGDEGQRIRKEAFAAARMEILQTQEHYEKDTLHLTDHQRVERRLDPDYGAGPLDLTTDQLEGIWEREGTGGPMPRAWLTQSTDLVWHSALDWILKKEHSWAELHQQAVTNYQETIDQGAAKQTITKRERETFELLQNLMDIHNKVEEQFRDLGIEPPPRPPHPAMPEKPDSKDQAKLALVLNAPGNDPTPASHRDAGPRPKKPANKPERMPIRMF